MKSNPNHRLLLKIILVSGILSILVGCSSPLETAVIATAQVINVAITPALRPLQSALTTCDQVHTELALFIHEIPAQALDLEQFDVVFRLGSAKEAIPYAVALGEEEIVVIVNKANPVTTLNKDDWQAILRGKIDNWLDIGGKDLPIEVWVYPPGDEARELVEDIYQDKLSWSSLAYLAPDPSAMLQVVTKSPGAIGFLPVAWLDEKVKAINLSVDLTNALYLPILAITTSEPQAGAYTLLVCLQSEQGQAVLKEKYKPFNIGN